MRKWAVCLVLVLAFVTSCAGHQVPKDGPLSEYDRQDPGHYLNSFLVEVDDHATAERVARDNGFLLIEKLPELDMYLLHHPEVTGRSKRSADDYVSRLKSDARVKFVEQQVTLRRVKRSHGILHDKQFGFPIQEVADNSQFYRNPDKFNTRDFGDPQYNDEYFKDQWYLRNEEQTGGKRHIDLNVLQAWEQGFTGRGVKVTTLDDGIDHEHPDIRRNYDAEASADMNDRSDVDNDPAPDKSSAGNSHGTRCAGEIAAEAGNGICGVGVAYDAKIGGIRILDGPITDELEARALLYKNQYIDIYSASWGPPDTGASMEGPKKACADALKRGVQTGRGGKGSIYVWATGNGGGNGDNCGADGYVSSPESISVQSLTDHGDMPFFGERCSSTMIAVPTGGEATEKEEMASRYKIKVVTTDLDGGCMENFEGTSGAAPLAAGCCALALQANPSLTWRDVQHVTVEAARISFDDSMWTINGAGYHVNDKFGFGMMDCSRMVELAQSWTNKPPQRICESQLQEVNEKIAGSRCYKTTIDFDACSGDSERSITHLEHVQLAVKASSGIRGNVEIFLESPSGTRSKLLSRRDADESSSDIDFTFMTVHSWMEDPVGTWTIEVCDNPGKTHTTRSNTIQLHSWLLRTYGFHDDGKETVTRGKAVTPDSKTVEDIMERELLTSRNINIKRANVNNFENDNTDKNAAWNKFSGKADNVFKSIGHIFGQRSFENDGNSKVFKNRMQNDAYKKQNILGDIDESYVNEDDKDINSIKREIVQILSRMDESELKSFTERYLQRKRELERKREMQELINQIDKYLDERK